ncbi:aminotransferase class IV [Sunxiuqinia sp. A32]|uniref:aminotransferase class IV n=1 Tax=Sunxiuqinia sp. A32 TaxID=3461496 RepID=UPI0040463E51
MKTDWILLDGNFHVNDAQLFTTSDLSSVLFSEKIRSIRNLFPFWDEHLTNIQQTFQILNLPQPGFLQNNGKELKRQLERFLSKNKLFKSALLDIQFLLPQNRIVYLITHQEINSTSFDLNKNGYIFEVSDAIQKATTSLSAYSFYSELNWKILERQTLPKSVSAYLLTNSNGDIIETPSKNIYLIKGNQIITPSKSTGAFMDVSRKAVRQIALELGFDFVETHELKQVLFLEAEEFFLASGIYGIEWVKGLYAKRYFSKTVRTISKEFNAKLIQ